MESSDVKKENLSSFETEAILAGDEDQSPVEQVALTVATTDNPTLPEWTFRMWSIGLLFCMLLAFLNQFFSYRKEPLIISPLTVQVAALPIGHFMAYALPTKKFRFPFTNKMVSLNPGPFNVKEHVLITIFANAGYAFGNGPAYAVGIVDIVKAFYHRKITFLAGWFVIITTQIIGTVVAGTVNIAVAWWLLNSITNICNTDLLPVSSPWTCPGDTVFFDASVIWGLVGPRRIFGDQGVYPALNWFFLGGALASVIVWLTHKAFPKVWWIPYVNMPVLLGALANMPPATAVNYTSWVIVGTIFNYFVFQYHKGWWKKYNYVLSAAMDAGLAFMAVALYFCLQLPDIGVTWWGTNGDHCPLATCPTAPGIVLPGCPVYT